MELEEEEKITLEMSPATAAANFALLRDLPANTRIYVDLMTGRMFPDNRYLSGARRWIGGTSRTDLVEPLRQTFQLMCDTPIPRDELFSIFNHTRERLVALYPEFDELFEEFRDEFFGSPSSAAPPQQRPAASAIRRRGSEVIILIPVEDFDTEGGEGELVDDEAPGCFPLSCRSVGKWCRKVFDFFRGTNRKRSD